MSKIKIDRATIRKNPTAGQTTFVMRGRATIKFRFEDRGHIPADLLDKVFISKWYGAADPGEGRLQEGYIDNPENVEVLSKIPGITIEIQSNNEVFHSIHPDPDYLYKHQDPVVACEGCGNEFHLSDADEVDFDGDGFADELFCPKCGRGFETEFEELTDVLNELGINP